MEGWRRKSISTAASELKAERRRVVGEKKGKGESEVEVHIMN